jgi:hypothetical protein
MKRKREKKRKRGEEELRREGRREEKEEREEMCFPLITCVLVGPLPSTIIWVTPATGRSCCWGSSPGVNAV